MDGHGQDAREVVDARGTAVKEIAGTGIVFARGNESKRTTGAGSGVGKNIEATVTEGTAVINIAVKVHAIVDIPRPKRTTGTARELRDREAGMAFTVGELETNVLVLTEG